MKWNTLKDGNTVARAKGLRFAISKTNYMPGLPYSNKTTNVKTGEKVRGCLMGRTVKSVQTQIEKLMAAI